MLNELEEDIENWYFHKQNSDRDLYKWLCIDTAQHCCPKNHFGPTCQPCLGPDLNRPCYGNGKCDVNF